MRSKFMKIYGKKKKSVPTKVINLSSADYVSARAVLGIFIAGFFS